MNQPRTDTLGFWDPESPTLTVAMVNASNFQQPPAMAVLEKPEGEPTAEPIRALEDAMYLLQPQQNSTESRNADGG